MTKRKPVRQLAPLVWSPSFDIFRAIVDRQHLLDDINELTELVFDMRPWPAVVAKSRELRTESIEHFRTEEDLLERLAYARLSQHRAEHQRLIGELDDIVEHLAALQAPSRGDLEAALLLRSLLLDHFFRKDFAYKPHVMAARGLS
jgi:hemerythrin